MKNKAFFTIGIIVILIGGGIFVWQYLGWNNEIITEGEWKTYIDEENGYSIQYPSGMVVLSPEKGGICNGLPVPSNLLFVLGSSKDEEELEEVESKEISGITIKFWKERLNIGYCPNVYHVGQEVVGGIINSLEDYRLFLIEPDVYTFTNTTINGCNAIKANISYPSLRKQFVFIEKPDGNIGVIEYTYGSKRYSDIAEKMISTFNFLK